MSDDVTIPAAFARIWAKNLRERYGVACAPLADLLDPPRSLRDEVADHLRLYNDPDSVPTAWLADADAVLAVVADRLDAQPLTEGYPREPITVAEFQRRHDVRLLRGGDDA